MAKNIVILGSTGSIGTQTLEVVRRNKNRLHVEALSANSNVDLMEEQIREFRPKLCAMYDEKSAEALRIKTADLGVKILSGMEGLEEIAAAEGADTVVSAVVGMIGINPAIAAIKSGKDIALANKETLVAAGDIIMKLVKEYGVRMIPVDSEHSAIFQCLNGESHESIEEILLTASGGPFRGKKTADLLNVTKEDALKHPSWSMGAKVTVDSASMVNKGLEVIEAMHLFGVSPDMIHVLIQPKSVVHSMVRFKDQSVMAQIGTPDMKLPIQYALTFPDRPSAAYEKLDFAKLSTISFEEPDLETFRGLALAFSAARSGGSMPAVFNAANEEAVDLFLHDKIKFLEIYEIIEKSLNTTEFIAEPRIEDIFEMEKNVRSKIRMS